MPHLAAASRWLDAPPGVAVRRRDPRERGARRAAGDALSLVRAPRCEELGVGIERRSVRVVAAAGGRRSSARICRAARAAAAGRTATSPNTARGFRRGRLEVTRGLRRGLALWIDYGLPRRQYYLPERRDGTLICHFRHRAHGDPFLQPGLQDITAWVDFTLLAEAGASRRISTLAGFCTQSYLLAALGSIAKCSHLAGGG